MIFLSLCFLRNSCLKENDLLICPYVSNIRSLGFKHRILWVNPYLKVEGELK